MISVVKGNIDGLAVDATVPTGLLPFGEAVCIGFTEPKANGAVNAAAPGREFFADTDKLRLATREVLLRAGERGQCHIAFPAAGQEAHAYDAAAKAIISETRRHLAYAGSIEKIIFSVFDDRAFDAFLRIAGRDQVACLGDSITFGYPYGPQPPGWPLQPRCPALSWSIWASTGTPPWTCCTALITT